MQSENASQAISVAAQITPAAARAASSYYTAAIDASKFERLLGLVQVGTLAGNASINARFQHCSGSASSLAAWADISSTSCITGTLGSGSNDKVQQLELRIEQNPTLSRFVRLAVINATSTWVGGATVLGVSSPYQPGSDNNSADAVAAVVY
jgi:hypothetical protein